MKVGTKKGVKAKIKKDPALLKAQQAAKKVRQQRQVLKPLSLGSE